MAALTGSGFVTAPPGVAVSDEDLPPSSQSTLLLQKKKDMAEVQLELERKKEQFRQRMQRCQEKEVELAAKQEAIKEQVSKFDKFLHDNDAKRVRANRKAIEEVKLREIKEIERLALVAELKRQQARKDELLAELARLQKFETFLEKACERHSDYFEDIEAILKRHHTLEATHSDLHAQILASEEQTIQLREALNELVKRTQTESLVNNSHIAAQQTTLDELRRSLQDRETDLAKHDAGAMDRMRMLGEVAMAIHNIYGRAFAQRRARASSSGVALDDEQSLLASLDAVKDRICDLQSIVRMLERNAAARAAEAAAVASGSGTLGEASTRGASISERGEGVRGDRPPGASIAASRRYVSTAAASRGPASRAQSMGASSLRGGSMTSVSSIRGGSTRGGDLPPLR